MDKVVPNIVVTLLFVMVIVAGCQRAVPASGPGPQAAVADQGLRPGDVVRLQIWREPTFSGDLTVDAAGVVVFPRLGPIEVTDESPETLRARLVRDYSRYLRNPSIEVQLLRRVQILGAVRNPGLYPVDATITVGDAIALAGGVAPEGRQNHVELIRGGERDRTVLPLRSRVADTPIRSGDQLYVPERTWLARNTGVIVGAATAAVSLLIAFASR